MRALLVALLLLLAGCSDAPADDPSPGPEESDEGDAAEDAGATSDPGDAPGNDTAGNTAGNATPGNETGPSVGNSTAGNVTDEPVGNITATEPFETGCRMGGTWFSRVAGGGFSNPVTFSATTSCSLEAPSAVGYVAVRLEVTGDGTGAISGARFVLRDAAGVQVVAAASGDTLSGSGAGEIPAEADLSTLTVSLEDHVGAMYDSSIEAKVTLFV